MFFLKEAMQIGSVCPFICAELLSFTRHLRIRLAFSISLQEFQLLQLSPLRVWTVDITDWHKHCSLQRVAMLVLLLFRPSTSLD